MFLVELVVRGKILPTAMGPLSDRLLKTAPPTSKGSRIGISPRAVAIIAWVLVILLVWISQARSDPPGAQSEAQSDKSETKKSAAEKPGKIAITFDDLPAVSIYESSERRHITERILNSLHEHGAQAAGFVVGGNINSDWDLLAAWLDEGHTLGSQTYSHYDLHVIPEEVFIEDMVKGATVLESFLSGFGQKARFFRHPYLHYGEKPKIRGRVEAILKDNKHKLAHVSIDIDDYIYNLKMDGLKRSDDSARFDVLRIEFIEHVLESIRRAESLANLVVNRPVKHVLALHANMLNAVFLGDLLSEIEDFGYEFVSLEDAIKDPLYRMQDEYYGPSGISKIERVARSDPKYIPPEF